MDEKRREEREHKICMTGRARLTASGVEDVDSFDDDKIVAFTSEGVMTVKGSELRINRLTVDDGELEIEGEICEILYEDGHKNDGGGLWSKIFR